MKIITANELRATARPTEDPVDIAIEAINKRLKARQISGFRDALIGYYEDTESFARLSVSDRDSIAQAYRLAGYHVEDGPTHATIKLRWHRETEA